MEQMNFKLENFEGPLDLLLHLISKHKLDICDIEISVLLDQYLDYIDGMDTQDFALAGEFLEMAARLIYIKTASLLPKPEEAQDLKRELEGKLIEYSLCKKAAELLRARDIGSDVFVRKPIKLSVDMTYTRTHHPMVLFDAFAGMRLRKKDAAPLKPSVFEPIVSHRVVSVISRIIRVLKRLSKEGSCPVCTLYEGDTEHSAQIATFLAVLELTKSGRIQLSDDNSQILFLGKSRSALTS